MIWKYDWVEGGHGKSYATLRPDQQQYVTDCVLSWMPRRWHGFDFKQRPDFMARAIKKAKEQRP